MKSFVFDLGQDIKLAMSQEKGVVIGRAEYIGSQDSYLVRYVAADGRQVEVWQSEDALVDASE